MTIQEETELKEKKCYYPKPEVAEYKMPGSNSLREQPTDALVTSKNDGNVQFGGAL